MAEKAGGRMKRCVVNVATDSWVVGQSRLKRRLEAIGEIGIFWTNQFPPGSPPHRTRGILGAPLSKTVPYAMKGFALHEAAKMGYTSLLWADACIYPLRPMDELWENIERDGYFICRNGWQNSDWCADSAYPDLFPGVPLEEARALNSQIPHVIATTFGVSTLHPTGKYILDEYFRLASETRAFCGPWQNTAAVPLKGVNTDRLAGPCGPPTTLGHRHDQVCLAVICNRAGCVLTDPPSIFAYKGSESDATILVADGNYHPK